MPIIELTEVESLFDEIIIIMFDRTFRIIPVLNISFATRDFILIYKKI